jgi:plasmid stability protein
MATTITIRHVPEEVRNTLAARAAKSGRSLQEFMLNEVTRLASKPSTADLLAEVREHKQRTGRHVGRKMILADRDADRR